VWLASHWGYGPVFTITAVAALLPLASVPALPGRLSTGQRSGGVLAGLRDPGLLRLALVFCASTVAAGVLVTFVPLAVTTTTATAALFAQPAATTAARWAAGRVGDRRGHGWLVRPGVLLSAAGMALLAATGMPAVVVCGAACFGTGFGLLQNATLALMYSNTSAGADGSTVNAIWNATFDGGMAAGAAVIGLVTAHTGYPVAFLLTAALITPALIPALHERAPQSARPT
jgi:predicted MFS family arabinose efflux permease